jgi:hypothetical protein
MLGRVKRSSNFRQSANPLRTRPNPKIVKREEIRRLVDAMGAGQPSPSISERLTELEAVVARIEGRLAELEAELAALQQNAVDPEDVAKKLAEFEGVWEAMWPSERSGLIHEVIEVVTCNGNGHARIALRMHGPLHIASQ